MSLFEINEQTIPADKLHAEYNIPDKLRNGLEWSQVHSPPKHPLESRLDGWYNHQSMLKLKLERNTYGLGTPMRKMMERKLVSEDVSMPALQQPRNLQKDVLDGVDEQITFADVHSVVDKPSAPTLDIHHEMQLKRRL
ncbi:hypothetical protein E3P81_00909 [Wallemia ichthyophaga]|nr:hypothetical protein E3P97_00910 [Wallemia ichthyophaga]TIB06330.1 hypothetical protein E3P96_00572 [Wallemia ichthyophaga]TIB34822.1 hypothetical protein E3P85_00764 [Wallemia ichthyophaga]TIB49282.1 hypothetical protein E3P82_00907 [Wallemia ichthyophaga]TIB53190.1 hypothetical protein E3P81_00909 [Wallemia ichthyophaga]